MFFLVVSIVVWYYNEIIIGKVLQDKLAVNPLDCLADIATIHVACGDFIHEFLGKNFGMVFQVKTYFLLSP